MEEERRLFYVAASRAKDELYFSVIRSRFEEEVEITPFLDFCVIKDNAVKKKKGLFK
jgi:superfamily I DNA/RNA helicase